MTNEIKLTEAQIRALQLASERGESSVYPSVGWGKDFAPASTLRALHKRKLVDRHTSRWGSYYVINAKGTEWLYDSGYLGVGGGGNVQFKVGQPVNFQDYGGAFRDGFIVAITHNENGFYYDIDKGSGGISEAIAAEYITLDTEEIKAQQANALDEPVSTLATVQATYISAKEKLELYMAADPELAKLRDAASDAKNAVDMARQRVITKALEAFAANPDERQVHPNVEIKMMTTFDYELSDATEWARENARYLLRLDTKAFERSVKSMDAPPACVTVSKEPKPFIARDLNGNS